MKPILTRVNRVFSPKMPGNAVILRKPKDLLDERNLTETRDGTGYKRPLKIQDLECK